MVTVLFASDRIIAIYYETLPCDAPSLFGDGTYHLQNKNCNILFLSLLLDFLVYLNTQESSSIKFNIYNNIIRLEKRV